MVRRVDTSDEDSNAQTPVKVKAEKTKIEKGKGKVQQEEGRSPKGAKRARVNDAGDAIPRDHEQDENGEEDPEEQEATPPPKRVKTLPRDVDEYIPGSIVRIQLRNFVTYDAVEFRPGPYLNMILGPNGTGKSSIACAICLGLNWSPAILGRAKELQSFVKIGADTGHIEIELKGAAGQRNLVIRRNLSAKSKGSSFTLNGHSATGNEITQRVSQLNVQVGNLCSFLPQDKVSSFAAMSPVGLLHETENAAGDERLKVWHSTLIDDGKKLKAMNETIQTETSTMRQLQQRNDQIERDVQRYKERKAIEHAMSLLRVLIPIQHYRESRDEFLDLKRLQRMQHLKVLRLKDRNMPAHEFLGKLDKEHQGLNEERESMKKKLREALAKVEQRTKKSQKLETEFETVQSDLVHLKSSEKTRQNTIKKTEAEIAKIQEELAVEVKMEKEADLRTEKHALTAAFGATSYGADLRALERRKEALESRRKTNERNENEGRRQLKDLDSVDSIRLNKLGNWDPAVADTVRWLRANKDKFKMQVFEPPAISVSVPDKAFAAAVESCFSGASFRMFVCQCDEDYKTLNNLINDNPGLGRSVRVPTWFRPPDERDLQPPPMSREELDDLGFDGYAIDYVDCPEGLKWYLKRELGLHRAAISRRGVRDLDRASKLVMRPDSRGRCPNTNYFDREIMHQVQRSKYGNREIISSALPLKAVKNFGGDSQVNPAEKQRVDEILQRCKEEATEITEEDRAIGMEDKRLGLLSKEHKAQVKAVDDRLAAITKEIEKRIKQEKKLEAAQRTLANAKNQGNAVEKGAKLRKRLMDITRQRVKYIAEAVDLSRDVITEQQRATTLGLYYLQVGAKMRVLKELCDRKDAKYVAALTEFNKIDEQFMKKKEETKRLLAASKEVLSNLPEEVVDEYEVIEKRRNAYDKAVLQAKEAGTEAPEPEEGIDLRTTEELRTELETQEANLEMNMNTNPGVVEQYEKRKREIEVLDKSIDSKQREAGRVEKSIKIARDNWEPALRSLVASIGKKFSAAFDRIGCAGEIRVREEEAYDQWAIDILVKFRDTEKLQLLTAHRQSGGERSLTTILYLMSLTEEARAPFSLVDEINQGMDQRAERMVHNSMVEVTCKPDSAQYFLITPKLLPDLEYHDRMKVLCVNNGEWLPEESGLGNMMSMIDAYVAKSGT